MAGAFEAAEEGLITSIGGLVDWATLRDALEVSPAQVLVLAGPDLRVAYQNPESARVVGRRPLGAPAAEAFPEYPTWVAALEEVRLDGRTIRYRRAPMTVETDGHAQVLVVDAVATPLLGRDGTVEAVVSQAVNVTHVPADDHRLRQALALARVTVELSRSLDVAQVTDAVSRSAAEVFEGWCLLDLFAADGSLQRVAITHHDPAMEPVIDQLKRLPRVSGRALGRTESVSATVARTGESTVGRFDTDVVVASATSAEHAETLRRLAPASYLSVPIQVGPRRLGALSVTRSVARPELTAEDMGVAEQFAERAAIALAHARDYDEQRQAVLVLQRTLLPPPPSSTAGPASLAVRYRAGGAGSEVGGDWYDVIGLDGGRLAVAIGDVEGHDLPAAAYMSQVRAVVHAFARSGLPPARVASEANRYLIDCGADRLVTLAYFEIAPEEGLVTWVRAGHVPAVVVPGDGTAAVVHGRGGLPLGVDPDAEWMEETAGLPPGALLAAFTDGLVELPGADIDARIALMASMLRDGAGDDLEALADRVLERFSDPVPSPDDVALVLLRLPAADLPRSARVARRLPPTSSSVTVARHFVTDLLTEWALDGDLIDTAALLTSELMSNAARHTDTDLELRVERSEGMVRIGVFDDSHRLPLPARQPADAPSGRGLQLVETLSAEWGVETEARGKVVWFSLRIP